MECQLYFFAINWKRLLDKLEALEHEEAPCQMQSNWFLFNLKGL